MLIVHSDNRFVLHPHIDIALFPFISLAVAFEYVYTVDRNYIPYTIATSFRFPNLASKHLHWDSYEAEVRQGRGQYQDSTRYPKAHGLYSPIHHHSD